MRRKIGDLQSL
nr:unnamed protein product [Callosobruchus analis]